MIHPVSALVVRADSSILECIQLMKKKDVGSILIVSDDADENLVGIFTERDLLRKVELIEKGKNWDKPIRTVMTESVKTLDIQEIEKAGEVLLENGFRHLPIVALKENGLPRLLGIVSMRDVFQKLFTEDQERTRKLRQTVQASNLWPPKHAFVSSQDKGVLDFISSLQSRFPLIGVHDLAVLKSQNSKAQIDFLIFDLDGLKAADWPKRLEKIELEAKPSYTLIFYNPALYGPKMQEALKHISKSGRYGIFSKPLNLLAVMEALEAVQWTIKE